MCIKGINRLYNYLITSNVGKIYTYIYILFIGIFYLDKIRDKKKKLILDVLSRYVSLEVVFTPNFDRVFPQDMCFVQNITLM